MPPHCLHLASTQSPRRHLPSRAFVPMRVLRVQREYRVHRVRSRVHCECCILHVLSSPHAFYSHLHLLLASHCLSQYPGTLPPSSQRAHQLPRPHLPIHSHPSPTPIHLPQTIVSSSNSCDRQPCRFLGAKILLASTFSSFSSFSSLLVHHPQFRCVSYVET